MRKHYKKKLHSCALCKPQKMKGGNRWNYKEFAKLKAFEQDKLEYVR